MVKLPEDEDTPEKRVKKIFRMMDKDENGSLDMAEFKVGLSPRNGDEAGCADYIRRREVSATRPSCQRCLFTTAWCELRDLNDPGGRTVWMYGCMAWALGVEAP